MTEVHNPEDDARTPPAANPPALTPAQQIIADAAAAAKTRPVPAALMRTSEPTGHLDVVAQDSSRSTSAEPDAAPESAATQPESDSTKLESDAVTLDFAPTTPARATRPVEAMAVDAEGVVGADEGGGAAAPEGVEAPADQVGRTDVTGPGSVSDGHSGTVASDLSESGLGVAEAGAGSTEVGEGSGEREISAIVSDVSARGGGDAELDEDEEELSEEEFRAALEAMLLVVDAPAPVELLASAMRAHPIRVE
ncbi:hypothetical protein ACWELQ_26975, partial [Nocardia sp. NPDC004722]